MFIIGKETAELRDSDGLRQKKSRRFHYQPSGFSEKTICAYSLLTVTRPVLKH